MEATLGYILNVADEGLPPESPFRSRDVIRAQAPVFCLEDGTPVFEAWFAFEGEWWVLTKIRDPQWPPTVRSFSSVTDLQEKLRTA